uniref:Uncharacterized protein n=1 Tax=Thermosporothrix sp. COM3 TaxID=2490863 RepID=A0A455SKB0_9CHLR|nr:hypothetical protein KTC_28110 [Thermosporothrix sp. COM3]
MIHSNSLEYQAAFEKAWGWLKKKQEGVACVDDGALAQLAHDAAVRLLLHKGGRTPTNQIQNVTGYLYKIVEHLRADFCKEQLRERNQTRNEFEARTRCHCSGDL